MFGNCAPERGEDLGPSEKEKRAGGFPVDRSDAPWQLDLVKLTVLLLSLHQQRPHGIARSLLMRFSRR
jgi:hypothetical protein